MIKTLVIGSGGREHAIVWVLRNKQIADNTAVIGSVLFVQRSMCLATCVCPEPDETSRDLVFARIAAT